MALNLQVKMERAAAREAARAAVQHAAAIAATRAQEALLARDLTKHERILVNTSAGKDSLVMLDVIVEMAIAQGVLDRVIAVHCDLGRVEWQGTRELAERQCARYGVPLHVIRREQGDLLQQVEERGMWPDSANRYCTSDQKRDQVQTLITRLVTEYCMELVGAAKLEGKSVRILNCLGLRAQESTKRRQEPVIKISDRGSSGVRSIDRWLPIHAWTEKQVWARIRERGLEYHYAYDLGMPRLSCCFCIFAPPEALELAGYHNRPLLDTYVALEQKINHTFKHELKLYDIQQKLDTGFIPGRVDSMKWMECGGGY